MMGQRGIAEARAGSVSSWRSLPRIEGVWRQRLPVICGAAAALALVVVIPQRILQGGYLTHVSGAWAALADDVAHGVLYRPLLSSLGYGGTRYFPLYFLLHGLLARAGLPLLAGGHLLSL